MTAGTASPGDPAGPANHYYPVFMDLRGRRCVLVGGGKEAADKLGPLLATGADVTVIAGQVAPAIAAAAEAGRIRLLARGLRRGDLQGARLVIDASGDDATGRLARAEADRERALLNVVDRAPLCDWIAPAVVDRHPVTIAISTAGESPFLAAAIRKRLEADFGAEWGPYTALVGDLRRRLRGSGVPLDDAERAYRRVLASPARALLRQGRQAAARAAVERAAAEPVRGRVTLAGAGPGSADQLTAAVRDALATADVVFHDALVEPDVLARCDPHTRLVDVGKRAGRPHVPQETVHRLLIDAARAGQDVVRLTGGDPFVFARGGEELAALVAAGVDTRVLPGLSSVTSAPTLAGIPLTFRGVASTVAFCTAQGDGPARLAELARTADTLVVLMTFAPIARVAEELAHALGGCRPAALVAGSGTLRERVVRSTLRQLPAAVAAADVEPPALLIVGEVVTTARAATERSAAAAECSR